MYRQKTTQHKHSAGSGLIKHTDTPYAQKQWKPKPQMAWPGAIRQMQSAPNMLTTNKKEFTFTLSESVALTFNFQSYQLLTAEHVS